PHQDPRHGRSGSQNPPTPYVPMPGRGAHSPRRAPYHHPVVPGIPPPQPQVRARAPQGRPAPGSHPPGPRLVREGARQGPAAPAQEGCTPGGRGPQGCCRYGPTRLGPQLEIWRDPSPGGKDQNPPHRDTDTPGSAGLYTKSIFLFSLFGLWCSNLFICLYLFLQICVFVYESLFIHFFLFTISNMICFINVLVTISFYNTPCGTPFPLGVPLLARGGLLLPCSLLDQLRAGWVAVLSVGRVSIGGPWLVTGVGVGGC
uniref:Uncharacterized protein n=1 Tax=Oryzias sinensis TaxID=183150 RepID=A0A8C8DRZ7_9TELE